MLVVHHLGVSQSERIVWLCEELEIPYELVRWERDPVTHMAPPGYKALHPFGTAPVVTDGDLVLAESGAIIDYVIGRYGNGRLWVGPASEDYPDYLFWFHFGNGSLMPAAIAVMVAQMSGGDGSVIIGTFHERVDRSYAMMEKRLGEAPYFGGSDLTAADIMMVFPMTRMRSFVPMDLALFPNVRAYLQRIGGRPAYQRAMTKSDPDMPPLLA